MITEDYVSFETAKLLKEKGFNEECSCFYNNIDYGTPGLEVDGQLYYINSALDDEEYAAPTLQMAMKWLRVVHRLDMDISIEYTTEKVYYYSILKRTAIRDIDCLHSETNFNSYEEACEAAIKYCLENLI